MKPWLALLVLSMTAGAAASEPFSIRCEGGQPAKVYYATLDPASKRVVFESASPINQYSGEIVNASDEKIELALRIFNQERLYLIWDSQRKQLIWPGAPDDPFRPRLSHPCRVMEARSILSFREPVEVSNPASIRCDVHPAGMFFTFDIPSGKVLYQRKHGSSYEGRIEKVDGDRVTFRLSSDERRAIVWDKRGQTVTVESIHGDASRPMTVDQCESIKPQSMLEYYDSRW